ncbi:P-loop containing nucleoside triphosphate hydrolase protein, partial [Phaeosphaeriaceae sp. PMI808]
MASDNSSNSQNADLQTGKVHDSSTTLPPWPATSSSRTVQVLQAQAEAPRLPTIVIPFPRNVDFVGRSAILDQIQQKCAVPCSRIALLGPGGIGKTDLAIEFAYRTRNQSPKTRVFWVHSSNAVRFEQGFHDIAKDAKIPGRRDPQASIFQLVNNWLYKSKERWLLVLDNLDDVHLLNNQAGQGHARHQSRRLHHYLPNCKRGSILITTRSRKVALRIARLRGLISIRPMPFPESVLLLKSKLRRRADDEDIFKLAAVLEYIPLAIIQAAAYINQKAPRCSVAQYVDLFEQNKLPAYAEDQLGRSFMVNNVFLTTWHISFEYIQQERPSAADLLSLMSFFDQHGIPEHVLWNRGVQKNMQTDHKEHKASAYSNEDIAQESSLGSKNMFDEDVMMLRDFCLISCDTRGTPFEVHAFVRQSTRIWLATTGKLERWKEQFIHNLNVAFPAVEYENWAECDALFAHVKQAAIMKLEDTSLSSQQDLAALLYRAAWHTKAIGRVDEAQRFALKSMELRNKVMGPENMDTLSSMAMLGSIYSLRRKWLEAEELYKLELELRTVKLGRDHSDTLITMVYLASMYRAQGKRLEAEELEEQLRQCTK